MKTAILAGVDNLAFFSMDLINPVELKLIGIAVPIEQAWNIYDKDGNVKEQIDELPVMPFEAAVSMEPEVILLSAGNEEDNEQLKYTVFRTGYRGEVISLYDHSKNFSARTAAIRKLAWRLEELGVPGAAADLGAGYGDISWQINALMPNRKIYLFESFAGYNEKDIQKKKERLLGRMPYPEQAEIRQGKFPQTAFELEDEMYAFVYIDTGLYSPTFSGIQYFFPRLNKGGVIVLSGYENGKNNDVKQAVADLEAQYGAFLITPLCDPEGTVIIMRP